MDAYPDASLSGRARAAEALRIIYAEPHEEPGQACARAKDLGFRQILISPPWAGFERRQRFLAQDFDAAGGQVLKAFAAAASASGLDLLLDVQVDRVAATSPLAADDRVPFEPPEAAALLDPRRGVDADAAVARLDGPGDALALAAWWAAHMRGWCQQGVTGFRLIGLSAFPDDLVSVFFGAIRQAVPEAVLLVWTPGMRRSAAAGLRGIGVDGVFASLPWWDFAASWVWDEIASLVQIAPVIGADALPGARETAPTARSLAFAATIGQGFLHSGAVQNDENVRALNGVLAACPLLSRLTPPYLPAGDGGPVLAFVRQDGVDHRVSSRAALVVVNTDPDRTLSFSAASVLPALGGVFGPFRSVLPESDHLLKPRTMFSLKPGEVRVFTAQALKRPGKVEALEKASARKAADWPRLAIERPTPCVDGGAFPVKAIAGELVGVEADIVFDGHDKISAALRWKAPGEPEWQEVPMRPLGNDRWQSAFPLERLGRHSYVVCAWRDRFETFRDELAKKSAAGVKIALELIEGETLVKQAAGRKKAPAADQLAGVLRALQAAGGEQEKLAILLAPDLAKAMAQADDRPFLVETAPIPVDAERIEARYASWYEVFPRSMSDDEHRHGTFADVERHLPRIRDMGFDVLYFPPIHPIGRTNRKGRNNTLTPAADDPGSPYAIGSEEGGHDALHPQLGTLEDFAHLREAAAAHGLELAIDFAIQCSPDHPWLKKHPGWFDWRPDGTIRYAENPPKKYEDIVNVDFYAKDAVPDLWLALCDVVLFWASQGVRLFRVDNPHTKPLPFWMWMIGEVRSRYPDAVFLAEAFTRPKVMYQLAKVGFSQSYTYFTWRNSKRELEEYFTELDTDAPKDFFRPHLFVNTPDINPVFLQSSGRPGFLIRAALAATLSGLWGVYNGFELCESSAIPGKEEYADSEKYQLRAWDWNRPGNIVQEITALNRIRRHNPALQTHRGVTFLLARNDAILYYEKATADRTNVVLVAVSLDPHQAQEADFEVPLWSWKLPDQASLNVEDLLSGDRFAWHGKMQHMRLTPERPYAVWRVRPI
jgi:starch synthase (maltosyl-transferring)